MDRELASHRGGRKRTRETTGNESALATSPKVTTPRRKRRERQKSVNDAVQKFNSLTTSSDSNNSNKTEKFPGFLSRKEHVDGRQRKHPDKRPAKSYARKSIEKETVHPDKGQTRNNKRSNEHKSNSNRKSFQTKKKATSPLNNTLGKAVAPEKHVLAWYSRFKHVPLDSEEKILKVLLHWGPTEHGMMKKQPAFRVHQIKRKCRSTGMYLAQALSLRRHHIKLLNPGKTMARLGLGQENDVRGAAAVFEEAVGNYLNHRGVKYQDEEEQKQEFWKNQKDGELMPPTPDFVLKESIDLLENGWASNAQHSINWIEAKMFYGASTIPHDDNSAVGRILLTARKYVNLYGPGAMVFSYGCGDRLAGELLNLGVIALDAGPVDLKKVENHQRRWCANKHGEILP